MKNGKKQKLVDHAIDTQFIAISKSREQLEPLKNNVLFKTLIIGQDEPEDIVDMDGHIADILGIQDGSVVILRPDLHVLARFKEFGRNEISEIMRRINSVKTEEK
ncbi:MAG: hypothetical protein GX070_01015 [Alcaligenaceae bacterium]|nr:hypothetical protein [Alcaligenaceae bacterium]